MAVVTSDFLAGLFTSFRVIWEEAFLAAQSAVDYTRYCTVVPSDTDTETYNWLGTVPKMSEWLDTRNLQGLGSFNYSIRNKSFESTIEVDRNTLEDDKYNIVRPRLAQLGMEAARYPSELAITTMVANGTCYDGVAFFATTHTEEGLANQANTAAGTGVTLATVRADFIAARTRMRRLTDGKGRPMNIVPDLVTIPPDLQDVFEQLINTNIIANNSVGMSNNLQGAADIMVDSNLADTADWFLQATKYAIKPMIYQSRKQPEFIAVTNPSEFNVFNTRKFYYGVDMRCNVGYGLWQMAQRITN